MNKLDFQITECVVFFWVGETLFIQYIQNKKKKNIKYIIIEQRVPNLLKVIILIHIYECYFFLSLSPIQSNIFCIIFVFFCFVFQLRNWIILIIILWAWKTNNIFVGSCCLFRFYSLVVVCVCWVQPISILSYFFFRSWVHFGQNHLPLGFVRSPTQAKWNHSMVH